VGRRVEPRNVKPGFRVAVCRCRWQGHPGHDTRHTSAKLLAGLDIHPCVAMQILQHSKISLTMEIYTEVPLEQTRAALKRLGHHLRQVGDGSDGKSS
jgi:integrase